MSGKQFYDRVVVHFFKSCFSLRKLAKYLAVFQERFIYFGWRNNAVGRHLMPVHSPDVNLPSNSEMSYLFEIRTGLWRYVLVTLNPHLDGGFCSLF